MICVACGFDLTSHPKIRRNLRESSKGHSLEVRKRVCGLWIYLASKVTTAPVMIRNNTKMCRNCFNDYDKYALKFTELKKKLNNAVL